MIINNTYFKGELYIPHAKPSITDDVTAVEGDILSFIEEYSRDCLIQCLGIQLFTELDNILDSDQPNGIDLAADDKWDALLNGTSYIDPATGNTVTWRGIRYKTNPIGEYDKSFLANYVYFYYEKHDHITRSDVGNVEENAKNAWNVKPTEKVVHAWSKFVDSVQGKIPRTKTEFHKGMPYVDYLSSSDHWDISLYKFIDDSNKIQKNTYADFRGRMWGRINSFGL